MGKVTLRNLVAHPVGPPHTSDVVVHPGGEAPDSSTDAVLAQDGAFPGFPWGHSH
jgi:hypothetical protein